MPANTNPIFTLTPNVGTVVIATTNALAKSDGSSTGGVADLMYKVFAAGANGSYLDKIRFFSVANVSPTTGVATTLRAFFSTIAAPGATTTANTFLLGEVSAPAIASDHSTNATNYYEIVLGISMQSGTFVHVAQHALQTTNQQWSAMAFGGDY